MWRWEVVLACVPAALAAEPTEGEAPPPAPKLLDALEAASAGTIAGQAPGEGITFEAAKAVAYLLKSQKEDGTWDTGSQVNPDTGKGITVGTTALAGLALTDWREVNAEGVAKALEKAADACIRDVWRKRESARDFESVAWGQLFTLQLLSRLKERPEHKERTEAWNKEFDAIRDLFFGRQNRTGGWGYAGSFQTAASILALQEIESAGASLPPGRLDKAVDFLLSLRSRIGYRYSQGQTEEHRKELGEPRCYKDSAARYGACALALLKAGKLKPEE